jgi:enterochelin esterase family protein
MRFSVVLSSALLLAAACSDDGQPVPDARPADAAADQTTADGAPDGPRPDGAAADGAETDAAETDATTPDAKSCTPAPPAPNRQLFTKLLADLKTLAGTAARKARIDTFFAAVAKTGRWPVRDATTVVFLYRGVPDGALSVAGTFNGWKAGVDLLTQLPDSDLYYLEKGLGTARQEYKLVTSKGTWLRDPRNEHVVWDGIQQAGVGAFNSVVPPWGSVDPAGELRWLQVTSPQLGNTRDVFVYLPVAYLSEACQSYPVLLVNDGNESLTRSHFDQVARAAFAAKQARPAVLVFVALASQNDRMSEYSCETSSSGPKYTNFLCDTLAPLIDKRYRTTASADSRGIIGASLGGLISYAAAFWRSDCFRVVGAQSGSFWFPTDSSGKETNMMVKRVQTMSKQAIKRTYLDNGTDNRTSTLAMRDALKAKGYPVHHWENLKQGHTWAAWHDRFDDALGALYPP